MLAIHGRDQFAAIQLCGCQDWQFQRHAEQVGCLWAQGTALDREHRAPKNHVDFDFDLGLGVLDQQFGVAEIPGVNFARGQLQSAQPVGNGVEFSADGFQGLLARSLPRRVDHIDID